ncbi:MAG: aminoglycoside phosphotransferase family protein [Actinocatenispora sp.]
MSIDIADALAAASHALETVTGERDQLRLVTRLRGGDRSLVLRAVGDRTGSVVVRAYEAGEQPPVCWAREVAALRILAPVAGAPVPRLLASGTEPPVTVLEDLGSGRSLADALLGADPADAERHLHQWVDAIADLHRETWGLGAQLGPEVARLAGQQPRSTVDELRNVPEALGNLVDVPAGLDAEIETLVAILGSQGHAVVTPTDACPDNNILTPAGLRLIDFEFAEYRHPAWDAAYLRVPFPSCWCSWAIPADVLDQALARYRRRLAPARPYVASPAFDAALDAATLAWTLISTAWFLPAALTEQPPIPDDGIVAPTRQAFLHHHMDRVAAARNIDELPAISRLARTVLARLRGRWPLSELVLQTAPSFR